nr:hypothetical protein [uncultured Capnocytophaga sp.]
MPVKFNVVERKNLLDKTAAPKFYASAKADGEVSLKALAKEIAQGSTTVSDTDVLAVLNDGADLREMLKTVKYEKYKK